MPIIIIIGRPKLEASARSPVSGACLADQTGKQAAAAARAREKIQSIII